jgi:hypothetical protein
MRRKYVWNLPNMAVINRVEVTNYGGIAFDVKRDVIYFEITYTQAYPAAIQACCFQNASCRA